MISFHRISSQLFWGNLLILTTVFCIGFLLTYHENRRLHEDAGKQLLGEIVEVVAMDLNRAIDDLQEKIISPLETEMLTQRIHSLCDVFRTRHDLRLTIIDQQGNVLGDSEQNPKLMEQHRTPNRPEIFAALNGQPGENVRKSQTMKMKFQYLALPLKQGEQVVGAVRVAYPYSNITTQGFHLFLVILYRFCLMLGASVFLLLLLGRIWVKPLQSITASSCAIAEGKLDEPIRISGPFELQKLATAMDRMRKTVSAQLRTISAQREDLRTIVAELKEAIIALDQSDQIVFANEAAMSLFQFPDSYEGKTLQSVLRHGTIIASYNELRNTKKVVSLPQDVVITGKRFSLELEVIPVSEEHDREITSIFVIRDHTELMKTTRMKTDFVANASHELRTPLATIRAALDNLLTIVSLENKVVDHSEDETLLHVSAVLDRHVSRLETMVRDLLDLYSVENNVITNHIELLAMQEIVLWLEELFRKRAEDKKISLIIDISDEIPPIPIDSKRLFLILQNLLDNAIKFTDHGGAVRLVIKEKSIPEIRHNENITRMIEISCEDNGCGIALEDQHRLFERFYQGNPSRTGDSRIRGTGLGLAIIKHAVERLHGTIKLTSHPNRGTSVIAQFPLEG